MHLDKICNYCGNSFITKSKYKAAERQMFCSSKCSIANKYKDNYRDGKKKCAKCQLFYPIESYSLRPARKGHKKINPYCNDCYSQKEKDRSSKRRQKESYKQWRLSRKINDGKRPKRWPQSKIYIYQDRYTNSLFVSSKKISERELDRRYKRRVLADKRAEKIKCKCLECGNEFEARKYTKSGYLVEMIRPNYCSKRCNKTALNRTKRVKERAIRKLVKSKRVNPLIVFQNHNWHCANCGCETPQYLRGTYEMNAPELDHIIPLSKGGEHTYENTQLLCRECNGYKSNRLDYAKTGIRTNGLLIQARETDISNHCQTH